MYIPVFLRTVVYATTVDPSQLRALLQQGLHTQYIRGCSLGTAGNIQRRSFYFLCLLFCRLSIHQLAHLRVLATTSTNTHKPSAQS
jgi:hypothetical protein